MCPQACFDVRNRHAGVERAERARRITLHHEQVRCRCQQWEHGDFHPPHVPVRVLLSRATEMHRRIGAEAQIAGIQSHVLVGEDRRVWCR